jgi:hypothetical protein
VVSSWHEGLCREIFHYKIIKVNLCCIYTALPPCNETRLAVANCRAGKEETTNNYTAIV